MTQRELSPQQVGREVRQAANKTVQSPVIRGIARIGLLAIAAVYLLTGVLAVRLALGIESVTPDKQVALQEILQAPFGRGLLGIMAIGLLGYALWRLIEALLDVNGKGTDIEGLAARAGYTVSAVVYSTLSVQAARLAMGSAQGGGNTEQTWTARLLAQPFGVWLVILLGLVVIGFGIAQIVYGWKKDFRENLALQKMSATEQRWATRAGQIGYIARGVVLGLVGAFFIQAALSFDPSQARGFGGALAELAGGRSSYLLFVVALGLAIYGLYALVLAKYHRVLSR